MRRMEIRARKIEFSNDFTMSEFRINPNIKFNARELNLKPEDKGEGNRRVFSLQLFSDKLQDLHPVRKSELFQQDPELQVLQQLLRLFHRLMR